MAPTNTTRPATERPGEHVDPDDLGVPRMRGAGPLRTTGLLAGDVGAARGGVLPPGRLSPVCGPFHRPPGGAG